MKPVIMFFATIAIAHGANSRSFAEDRWITYKSGELSDSSKTALNTFKEKYDFSKACDANTAKFAEDLMTAVSKCTVCGAAYAAAITTPPPAPKAAALSIAAVTCDKADAPKAIRAAFESGKQWSECKELNALYEKYKTQCEGKDQIMWVSKDMIVCYHKDSKEPVFIHDAKTDITKIMKE